jgi:uracil phosphoribosyltransferase
MLATGGSAMKAVEVLMESGVPEDRIIFVNLISSPEGLRAFCGKYTKLKVVSAFPFFSIPFAQKQITGWIDEGLNEKAYIIPGLGDFGERR